ncbi:hypothetical protein EDD16DRAFT_1626498 [Pisolithus croceorrhizus]|nr:hypothetical protein EDD16DRAFT_1626498 [Pisolithus croceorrhizus]
MGCADSVDCFFYVFPTFPFTILRRFVSIALVVIIRAPSPFPIPLLCCSIAYAIAPSVRG